jgi:HAD superfamily hydrolase (TIGR01509 family)
MITTIFFDNDGVLVDTEKYYFEANRTICARYGHSLTENEYRELFLRNNGGMRGIFETKGWSEQQVTAVRKERDEFYAGLLQSREIMLPGVGDGLARLAQRFDLCMVTSSPRFCLDIIHGRTGFFPFFKLIVGEEQVTKHKPDPEPYLTALRLMNVSPGSGIAVEDTERGVLSATGAGLRCIAAPRPLTEAQNFSAAVSIVRSFDEVVRTIERIADEEE